MAFERREAEPAAGRVRAEEEKEAFPEIQRAALITAWKQKGLQKPAVRGAGHDVSYINAVGRHRYDFLTAMLR